MQKEAKSRAATVKASKITAKNNIVLLRKRPLVNTTAIRSSNSTLSLRSTTSLKQSNRSSPISKNVRSTPNIPSRLEHHHGREITIPTPPWHHNNNEIKIHGRLKRPIANVTTRRGQTQASSKSEPGQIRDDLTRCSSATNLNVDTKSKGAFSKLRKSASKDKLDKLTEKKNERVSSNNNKLNSDSVDEALESIQEVEILQKQLTEMAKEKCDLALELGERKGELQMLKSEIVKLKEQSVVRLEQLSDENTSLRNRLRDVAHSPLSDNEKRQLLLDTERHSSAPASIATNISLLDDDITSCPTPDWDKHSSSNVSEVSVACLQDKINQMQETHYSTNEELQATLQELTDLQRQLTELQQDNERLSDEKNLMFDSLCRQTERLNDARTEVESLKQLLYRDKDENGQFESIVDREQKLVNLLKSAQEERESLLLKQEQLSNELQDAHASNIEQSSEIEQLTERVRTLESTLDAKHAEHKQLDQELAIAKDQCSGRQIEINRLTDLLENARTKINELEQERALNDKSELDELLDNARKEKDALESEVANLKEQVARSRNETEKFREQVSILQEECKVTRNNAKCTQSELEYKCERLIVEKSNVNEQLQQLQEAANELQVQAQCQLEDKRQLSTVLSETQRNLSEAERKNNELDNEIDELKRLRTDENEEWEKFQNDLLTSVRVANDFKSEAQQELQKMIMENKTHRERIRQLETQIDKLKDFNDNPGQGNIASDPNPEARNLAILNDLYLQINPNHTEEQLTPDEKYIIKVKDALDADQPKIKPTARKPKDQLAISKPLLTSVLSNPQLRDITENVNLTSIEDAEECESVDDVSVPDSMMANNDSHIDKTNIKYETLEELYDKIDLSKSEDELTKEEKFVIKLKHSLDEMGRKTTLKKIATKHKKKLRISEPIFTSVFSNQKLVSVLSDPNIKTVHELTDCRSSLESSSLDDFLKSLFKIPRPTLLGQQRMKHYDSIDDVLHDLKLRSNLDEEEFNLVQRIHMNPVYSRPSSDLNDDDLEIIAFAQAHTSNEQKRPIPLPRSKSYQGSCVNDDRITVFDSNSDTFKILSADREEMNQEQNNEAAKVEAFRNVDEYYTDSCKSEVPSCDVIKLFNNEYSNTSSFSNFPNVNHVNSSAKDTLTQTDSVIVIEESLKKIDVVEPRIISHSGVDSPEPCLKVMGNYVSPVGDYRTDDSPVEGILREFSKPAITKPFPNELESQSSFYKARKKFECLIQASNFRSEVMKQTTLRSFSKNT